ncbi:DUF4157 domain-containing protein [Dyella sp. 2HG41-7]|uniref:eCIS core domain-containing protein n=1 Tax=Dyella sp. 2HG41-7 TaxID=2883239 RepID=UPI001F19EF94|nr:DUF4157 domain-containing protein [Dyella sp. 2HG41-7]
MPETIWVSRPGNSSEQEADRLARNDHNPAAYGNPTTYQAPDFSRIRLHTDLQAARATRELGTRAFAYGQHIVIDGAHYAPGTPGGMLLLAHELAHALQAGPSSIWILMRDTPSDQSDTKGTTLEGGVSMSVTMDGLRFQFTNVTLKEGSPRLQLLALILRRLVGEQYKTGLENTVSDKLNMPSIEASGLLNINAPSSPGKKVTQIAIDLGATTDLLNVLKALQLPTTLTSTQTDLIAKGLAAVDAWEKLKEGFPKWYTLWIFKREMSQQGELLETWQNARKDTSSAGDMQRINALNSIESALIDHANLVDIIRADVALANEANKPTNELLVKRDREHAAATYAAMFNVQLSADHPITAAPESVNVNVVANFLGYLHTQETVAANAAGDDSKAHDARTQLLGRYGRFVLRAYGHEGDEQILKHPARANAPPWDAVLSDAPPLSPPLYEAALETDHAFTMQLQWQHWTDAMVTYSYMWEFIRVPDSKLGAPAFDATQAAGERPSASKVFGTRWARARRYNAADIERIHHDLGDKPWGQAAEDLVEIGNALRYVGTVVHFILDKLTEPAYVARYVFPGAGLYIVRCRAIPIVDDDKEIKRQPSVAYLPVVARDPDEMAIAEVNEANRSQFQANLRIAEIQSLLASPFPPENAEALKREMKDLQSMLLAPTEALHQRGDVLDAQIAALQKRLDLRKQIADIQALPETQRDAARLAELQRQLVAAGGESGSKYFEERELESLRSQRDVNKNLQDMEADRTKNETGFRFSPVVSFVSDVGQSLQLAVEMFDRGEHDGEYQVFISDLTTPDSGKALGTAPATDKNPRVQAIRNGLKKLLEESSDYGRGRVAFSIDGVTYFQRIEAGTGRMLTEAADNAATVASLAAIALAPITDGASLFLLLPIGAAGAVTSAYRLYQRYDENRLRLDFAAVMDVVNIVGGVLGLAQAATPLRAVRLGKVLAVMGVGMDGAGVMMMGAGIMVQLDALQSLPEHERAARMLEILGGGMMQLGIQVGGAVMHARYQSHRSAAAGQSGEHLTANEEPGFHPASPEELAAAEAKAKASPPPSGASDRSMAGSGGPPGDKPPPAKTPAGTGKPASAKSKASPERLFELLQQGVDRSRPPPLPDAAVKSPPKSGEYQRGLMTADAAYAAYNKALAVSTGREVAIYHNPDTGEYRIMIGSETGVRAPEAAGWNALVHYHPNEGNALTFRLPAPQDFRGLMFRFFAEGVAVREFIEFTIPGVGRGRTEYGIEPGVAEPYYVRINQPDGTSRTIRFANDGHYSAYWGERTVAVPEGSPVYDAMIRDIESYIRSIRGNEPPEFGPHEKTTSGDTGSAPAATDKSVAKSKTAQQATGAMQSGTGDLTDEGVAFIRSRFKTVSEGRGKKIELASLTDAQIKERFPNQSAWLEAIVTAQARSDWLGRSTPTDFALTDPTQNFNDVAAKLDTAIAKGKTGHSLHKDMLGWNVKDFVDEMLRQGDPTLTAAYNACEHNTNPDVVKRWQEFKNSTKKGDMCGFFLGKVGSKRPDIVEVMLSQNEIHITDASFAYGDPIHNFKSAFYKVVMERLINVTTVTSTDYRSPLRQTPI